MVRDGKKYRKRDKVNSKALNAADLENGFVMHVGFLSFPPDIA
jgi:hypothetical protein